MKAEASVRAGGHRHPPLAQLLLKRFRWLDLALRDHLAASGWPHLTGSQSLVMASLPADGTRPAHLARHLGVTRQSLHQSVNELRGMGLVETVSDPEDARAQIVRLTEHGCKNVAAELEAFAFVEDELGRRIGVEHLARLRAALVADWGAPPVRDI